MSLTLASLFDGIGGFPLAFARAGVRTVATVEIDKAAAAISRRHFPDAHQFDDVTKVTGDDLRAVGFVPGRGILTAGWPCQDFSVAGRRAGLAGERSGLWWHVARILDELRPLWFVGENVPGLLSSVCQCPGDGTCVANGHRGPCKPGESHDVAPDGCCVGGCMATHGGAMGSVLGSLAELGYGIAYRVLDAQFFGVPQQRKRVFIVGHLGAPWGAPAQVLLEPESGGGDSSAGGQAWPDVAGTLMAGANATGGTRPPGTQVDTVNTLVVAPTVTAKWAKGTGGPAGDETQNLVVTPEASTHTHTHRRGDVAGRREAGLPDRRRISSRGAPHHREVVSAMTTSYCGGVGGPDDNAAQAGYLIVDYAPDVAATLTAGTSSPGVSAPGRRQEDDTNLVVQPTTVLGGVTHTLTSEGFDASEDGTGRGTPIVALRENQRGELSTSDVTGALSAGGGKPGQGYPCIVQPLAVRGREGGSQLEVGEPGAPYNALRAGDGGSSRQSLVAITSSETVVRRLTELECERLQGYPDQYTDGQSGSARYRQLGNSVAVPNVEWVARRLVAVDRAVAESLGVTA